LISGSGASGQLLGLRIVTGVTAVTATNASPSAATNYSAIGNLIQTVSNASGERPDLLVLAPRRAEWIRAKLGFAPDWYGLQVIESPSMPTNLGAGTNQDPVIVLNKSEVILYEKPATFAAYEQVGSSTQTVRISAWGYAALQAARQPTSIGVSTGTEWTGPTF